MVLEHMQAWAKRQYETAEVHGWIALNAANLGRVAQLAELINKIMEPTQLEQKPNEE
jgi:hypothetical protein